MTQITGTTFGGRTITREVTSAFDSSDSRDWSPEERAEYEAWLVERNASLGAIDMDDMEADLAFDAARERRRAP